MNKKYMRKILENPLENRNWTVTGFGKIGCVFTPNTKIHIWDRLALQSTIPAVHSHSYDFKSFVVVGKVRNLKMIESESGESWNKVLVTSSAEVVEGPLSAKLSELPMEVYEEREVYNQPYDEVHWSMPDDGTVTLVEWKYNDAPKHMKVYWRGNYPWQDAKSHQAPDELVTKIAKRVLALWY